MREDTDESKLLLACNEGDMEMVQYLLNRNVDISYEDYYGWTALKMATDGLRYDIVTLLLDHREHIVNFQDSYKENESNAFIVASYGGDAHMVCLLLD
jgi:ankyrin repeat protein